jgi:SAM-dependent methyltransferase
MKSVGEALPPCPICSGQNTLFVSERADFPSTGIWFCSACNHWFSYPEPDGLELDRYYTQTYSPRRKIYFGEEYYVFMERRASAQIRFISDYLSQSGMLGSLRGWRIIDWGCGVGALVALLQRGGVDAVGYDSDLEAIEVGRKRWAANISVSSSYDLGVLQGRFDLLLLSHVVEHLPDIRQTLQGLLRVVRPGGFVFVEVPNCSAEMFSVPMDPESHLQFFSRRSLVHILEGLGVQVLACVSCGPPNPSESHQREIPAVLDCAQRLARQAKTRLGNIVERLGLRARHVRTICDGFYEHYSPGENGLWLRLLGQIQSSVLPDMHAIDDSLDELTDRARQL